MREECINNTDLSGSNCKTKLSSFDVEFTHQNQKKDKDYVRIEVTFDEYGEVKSQAVDDEQSGIDKAQSEKSFNSVYENGQLGSRDALFKAPLSNGQIQQSHAVVANTGQKLTVRMPAVTYAGLLSIGTASAGLGGYALAVKIGVFAASSLALACPVALITVGSILIIGVLCHAMYSAYKNVPDHTLPSKLSERSKNNPATCYDYEDASDAVLAYRP